MYIGIWNNTEQAYIRVLTLMSSRNFQHQARRRSGLDHGDGRVDSDVPAGSTRSWLHGGRPVHALPGPAEQEQEGQSPAPNPEPLLLRHWLRRRQRRQPQQILQVLKRSSGNRVIPAVPSKAI